MKALFLAASLWITSFWVASPPTYEHPEDYYLSSNAGHWISVYRPCQPPQKPYDPQCTMIFTSCKPVLTELTDRRWMITFIPNNKIP